MSNNDSKRIPLNKEFVVLVKGLIIGKVLTLMAIGGFLSWLKPGLWNDNGTSFANSSGTASAATNTSTFQSLTDIPTGSFNYGGSTAWAPIRQLVDAQIQNVRPELQLRYLNPVSDTPGSSSGIRMLINGQLDFAQSSRPLKKEEYEIAQQRGFKLEQHSVGVDAIAVVVNPSLKVPGLTIDQLRQIYQGQITNWNQVGGPKLPITPFSQRPEDIDTLIFSENSALEFSSNVKYVYSTTEALRQVRNTPGGLYYASARGVVSQCSVKPLPLGLTPNQLVPPYREPLVLPEQCPLQRNQINPEVIKNGSYPITYNLYVITKLNKGHEQQVGEAYTKLLLTNQGQKAIEQAGFMGQR